MAWGNVPQDLLDEQLMAGSVMNPPRTPWQRIGDFAFGRTPSERLAGFAPGTISYSPAMQPFRQMIENAMPSRILAAIKRSPKQISLSEGMPRVGNLASYTPETGEAIISPFNVLSNKEVLRSALHEVAGHGGLDVTGPIHTQPPGFRFGPGIRDWLQSVGYREPNLGGELFPMSFSHPESIVTPQTGQEMTDALEWMANRFGRSVRETARQRAAMKATVR